MLGRPFSKHVPTDGTCNIHALLWNGSDVNYHWKGADHFVRTYLGHLVVLAIEGVYIDAAMSEI